MKVLITGGHFSPAFSVITELKKRGIEVAVAGRRFALEGDNIESFEYLTCVEEKIPFFELKTGRLQRRITPFTFSSLTKIPSGFFAAHKILRSYNPDIVLTFGGYLGVPVSAAAGLLGIPVVLHEQTQSVGLSAKLIAPIAQKILISFQSSKKYFPQSKTVFTGNPLRQDIFEVKKKFDLPKGQVIYVTGGSTGAHILNSIVYEILEQLLSEFVVIHQSGDSREFADFKRLSEKYESLKPDLKKKYILRKFINPDEIGFVFKNADLVLSRAGANTVSELIALNKRALLVPLIGGQNNEQLENAKYLKTEGNGDYIEEQDANPEIVFEKIKEMIKSGTSENRKPISNAAELVVDEIQKAYDQKER